MTNKQTTDNSPGSLGNRAMLVNLSIGQWGATAQDKQAAKVIAAQYHTTEDAGKYQKNLVDKNRLETISRFVTQVRAFNYQQTLPWLDNGYRILPAASFEVYSEKIRDFEAQFETLVSDFCGDYPILREQARAKLNGLFNEDDYPENIRSKFSFRYDVLPLPQSSDFRVEIPGPELAKVKDRITQQVQRAQTAATADLWKRLHKYIKRMVDSLGSDKPKIHDTLISNLTELADLLPALNLAQDNDLAAMEKDIRDRLLKFDTVTLKKDKVARADTARAASEMLATVEKAQGPTQPSTLEKALNMTNEEVQAAQEKREKIDKLVSGMSPYFGGPQQ